MLQLLLRCLVVASLCACGGSKTGGIQGTGDGGGTPDAPTSDTGPPPSDTPPSGDGSEIPGPSLTALPMTIQFGATQPGVPRAAQFILRNQGGEPLEVTGAAFNGAPVGEFAFGATDPMGVLAPGAERTVDLVFQSNDLGSHNATLTIEATPDVAPLTLALTAIVTVAPSTVIVELTSSAAGLKFGAVEVGKQKTIDFFLVNSGNAPLQIVQMAMDPTSDADFSFQTDKSIPTLIGAGEKIKVSATYAPDKVESDSGVLTVNNSAPNTPVLKVPMTGSGYADPCSATVVCGPDPMNFGVVPLGQPKAVTLVCTNTGVAPVTIQTMTVALNANDGFTWTVPALPKTLNAGEGLALPVLYTAADTATKTGAVTVVSDICGPQTQVIPVTASGKQPVPPPPCLEASEFQPKVEWEWAPSDAQSSHSMVFMAPIVINLDDDNGDGAIDGEDIPEVIFVGHSGGNPFAINDDHPGALRAVHGQDGSPMWLSFEDGHQVSWASNLAAAELDGIPGPEIVGVAYTPSPAGTNCPGVPDIFPMSICGKYVTGHLVAFHGADGSPFWKSAPFSGAVSDLENMGGPTIADLNADGVAEVILGSHVFSGLDGSLMWVGTAGRGNDGHGYLTLVGDLDGDQVPDVLAGNTAYRNDGTILWQANIGDTHGTAIADLDNNGTMEAFINGPTGQSIVVDGATGATIAGPVNTGIIGCCVAAPAISDVDVSKPGLEIVTAADEKLRVYDKNLNLIWEKAISDETGAAGPAVFDVEGDGVAEVVYADEGNLWVFRGSNGQVIFEADRSSATGLDNPVIADVDGDNHAEILVPMETGFGGPGLRLYANTDDSWVATRRIWNQHAYSVSNIYDNGVVPITGTTDAFGPTLLRANVPTCQ